MEEIGAEERDAKRDKQRVAGHHSNEGSARAREQRRREGYNTT